MSGFIWELSASSILTFAGDPGEDRGVQQQAGGQARGAGGAHVPQVRHLVLVCPLALRTALCPCCAMPMLRTLRPSVSTATCTPQTSTQTRRARLELKLKLKLRAGVAAEFDTAVPENDPFREPLSKVFYRKIKRSKKKAGGAEGEDEDSEVRPPGVCHCGRSAL